MLKTLPVFVLEYGQAVYGKEEYRQCLNILKLKIKNIIANNEEKVKAEYTYGATGGVTYGNGTSTSYMYNKGNMIEKVTNNNADTISPQIKEGLLDMYWQLKNGLYDYDNLFEGIARGDIDKIREESKVTYKSKNTGKRYFDSGRYKHRIDNYFHY